MIAVAGKKALIVCPFLEKGGLEKQGLEKNDPEQNGPEQSSGGLAWPLFHALEQGNTPVAAPLANEVDWTDPDRARQYLQQYKPQIVISVPPVSDALTGLFADKTRFNAVTETVTNLAAACAGSGSMLMHISDYHVFGGETKNTYIESDTPAPLDDFGQALLDMETCIASQVEQHVILRFSWLIGIHNSNLLTRILRCLMAGGDMALSRHRRGGPTWEEDAVRVILGVVRQTMAGAKNWGNFHYCSDDACNEWEFGRHVYDVLGTLRESRGRIIQEKEKKEKGETDGPRHLARPAEPASATLGCRRIRNNFGVHPRTWRQGMKANISQWLGDL